MEKTSQKVKNNPKRDEAARKGRENCMKKLKEKYLNDAKKGSGDTSNASNETTSTTNNATIPVTSTTNTATARSNEPHMELVFIYGVAILATGVCVFFTYNTSQAENKKQANEKRDQPPKRRHML